MPKDTFSCVELLDDTLACMPRFPYVITVESIEPPTAEARAAMLQVLDEEGFSDLTPEPEQKSMKFQVAGTSPARADQLAFAMRDKLGDIWKGTTVLVSEPKPLAEE